MVVPGHRVVAGSHPDDAWRRPSPSCRAAYASKSLGWTRRGAVAYCVTAAAVLVATAPLDRVRFPELASTLLVVRVAGAVVLALVAVLLHSAHSHRHPRLLGLLAPGVAGIALHTLAAFTGGDVSPINVSANFAILGAALLIPWPATWCALAAAVIVGEYLVRDLAFQPIPIGPAFIDDLMVFAASSATAIVTAGVRERRRWREFGQHWALREAHREARESAERYRSLVETAGSVIVVVSADGRIVEFNREAERVLGWSRAEAIGRDYVEVCMLDVGRSDAAGGSSCAAQPSRGLEVRAVTRDGREVYLVCNTSPVVDRAGGVIVCAQDITDRTRVEKALRESEARLRAVIGSTPVVLFALDQRGVVTLSEGKGLERLGLAPGEMVGRHIVHALARFGADRASYGQYLERAIAGELTSWVGSIGEATFECRLVPMHGAGGTVTGLIGLAIDLTERKQVEDARLALERTLLENRRLESLGVMAGGIAHDFNNLLVNVLGNASLVQADLPGDSSARRRVAQIEVAAQRASDLTRQLLAYAGQGSTSIEMVDVNSLIEETEGLLQVSVGANVTVHNELDDTLPAIAADPVQIRQVVMNLLVNAAEGIGGTGRIDVRTESVWLDEAALQDSYHHGPEIAPGPYVCIEVEDTGCGMSAAVLERIFDPFFSTKFTGRGLGLAIVLGVVREHHGALQVKSQPGSGTTFRVLFPTGGERVPIGAAAPTPLPDRGDTGRRTVLLIDDEEEVRAVTRDMLERLGCVVLVAGDGREGVEVFRAHAAVIDAVLVDLTLPRLRGDRACSEIRGIAAGARVIVMSGYDERAIHQLADDGAAAFLRKPFSLADLRATMDTVFHTRGPYAPS